MNNRTGFLWVIVGAVVILFSGCAGMIERGMAEASYGPSEAAKRVLVAAVDSEYKRQIVLALATRLTELGVALDVVPLADFEIAQKAKDYQAWVLVATIKAGKEDSRVRKARTAHPNDPRLFVLNTKGGAGTKGDADTTTAASGTAPETLIKPILDRLKI
ncbi:MAG: hypothetical protein WCT14_02095 [Treponemataceae bacterium]